MSYPVATLVQLLAETTDDPEFLLWNLRHLNKECSTHWFSIATKVTELEKLEASLTDEDARNGSRLLLSQVYFHLNEYPKALESACMSGRWFLDYLDAFYSTADQQESMGENEGRPLPSAREYVDKIVSLCIESYVAARHSTNSTQTSSEHQADRQLKHLVDYIIKLDRASELPEHIHKLLLGIALDSQNTEYLQKVIELDPLTLMRYTMASHELLLSSKGFQQTVFEVIRDVYRTKFYTSDQISRENLRKYADELPNYFQALYMCNEGAAIADLLRDLIDTKDERDLLRVYQLAFDLFSYGSQSLIKDVRLHPRLKFTAKPLVQTAQITQTPNDAPSAAANTTAVDEERIPDDAPADVKTTDELTDQDSILEKIESILTGKFQARILLKFSNAQNKTDLTILETLMQGIGVRVPILHTMLVVAHSFMQRGTTCDIFLRLNLDWFSKPTLWGKFIATGSLGVIHQTHNDKSFRVLSIYLPGIPGWTPGSSYTDGGALYALGLIHANMATDEVIKYLLAQLSGRPEQTGQAASNERSVNDVLQYGASLALGLTAMGSGDTTVCEALEAVLMMDSAVAGEAAALGLGLVNLGTCDQQLIEALLTYAEETRHEKIIRACGLGVAFLCVKMQEKADPYVQRMLASSDPVIRYGGCFTLALAHVGTARQSALRNLLHIAVSDPIDDVRQGAVISISFLLSNSPDQAPKIFKFLADSFNFRVRFAAILGLGMTCAGTANSEALAIIKSATKDAHDLVRQAAFIALGLVLIECPEKIGAERLAEHDSAEITAAKAEAENSADAAEAKDKAAAKDKTKDKAGAKDSSAEASKDDAAKKETEAAAPGMTTPMQVRCEMINVALDLREDAMARLGAILGLGIIDGGGRNCNISMLHRENLVGMVLFAQYWYSYPLLLCLSLSFTPTPLLGVNSALRLPDKFQVQAVNCPPSLFAYTPKYQKDYKDKNARLKFNTSWLAAGGRKAKRTGKQIGGEPAEANAAAKVPETEPVPAPAPDVAMEGPEPNVTVINNGSRIVPMQVPMLKQQTGASNRFTPIFPRRKFQSEGIIVLVDNQPNSTEDKFIME